ncbi:hypothetical protein D3C73_1664880 [compost metagenome]
MVETTLGISLMSFLKVSVSSNNATREIRAAPIMYQATEEPLPVAASNAVVTIGVAALPSRPDNM